MTTSYEILTAPDAVYAKYRGTISLAEARAMFDAYRSGPDFALERPHIVDVKDIDISDVGFAEVFSLFAMFESTYRAAGAKLRVAIITDQDLAFGLSRIFENLAEQSDWAEAQIFESRAAAIAWITAQG